jgi:hypothetical protein
MGVADLDGSTDGSADGAGIFRRHVLYIPGYDPFPPRRYRELYRTEGAAQAAISGYGLMIRSRAGETYGWRVAAKIEGRAVEAEVEVLVWSDLVKGSMGRGISGTYGQLLRTAWLYVSSGALLRLIRLRKGPMIAALYPAVALVVQALLAALLSGLVLWLGWRLPLGLGWLLAFGAGGAVLEGFRRIDHRLFVYYLMHDYAFTTVEGGVYPAVLEERLAVFRARVRAAVTSGVEEVLVVGHSSGVHLGVSVLADLIREGVPGGSALGSVAARGTDLGRCHRTGRRLQLCFVRPGRGQRGGTRGPAVAADPIGGVHPDAECRTLESAASAIFPAAFPISLRL